MSLWEPFSQAVDRWLNYIHLSQHCKHLNYVEEIHLENVAVIWDFIQYTEVIKFAYTRELYTHMSHSSQKLN